MRATATDCLRCIALDRIDALDCDAICRVPMSAPIGRTDTSLMSMRTAVRLSTAFVLALLIAGSQAAGAAVENEVRGAVSDTSGGVLPGVLVAATSATGEPIDSSITDEHGAFVLPHVTRATVTLTFQLDGFSTKSVQLDVRPDVEPWVAAVLTLAPRTETVVVYGKAPVDARAPQVMPRPDPPPAVVPVPEHDRDSVCGPALPTGDASFGTIRSGKVDKARQLYAQGDQLLIDGGTHSGLEVGHNYVVKRMYRVRGASRDATLEHSAGVLQVVAADERAAIAVVVYACDVLMRGDVLSAFHPEPVRTAEPFGIPAFDDAARILFADIGQQLGAPRRLMVIDRGSDADLRVGQTLTLFRREGGSSFSPSVVGAATIVAVHEHSATIRVDQGRDAIDSGDWAAPQRYEPHVAAIPVDEDRQLR
jgi:hypothetical protein